jgi:hypothetical protein
MTAIKELFVIKKTGSQYIGSDTFSPTGETTFPDGRAPFPIGRKDFPIPE